MKTLKLMTPVLLACLLAACGGGEDGGATTALTTGTTQTQTTDSPSVTGSVSAPFAGSSASRYMIFGVGSQRWGRLDNHTQATGGAMTALNDMSLGGTSVVRDISGDANTTQGRWAGGTVTTSTGASVMTGDNAAYHYVAFNVRSTPFPASGNLTCDAGTFTTPTYVGGGGGTFASSGSATGQASLAFGPTGAAINASVTGTANGVTATSSLSRTVEMPSDMAVVGNILGGAAGAVLAIGDAGTADYLVLAAYSQTYPSGARYQGMATFRCK